ncbi:leukemia-associated protein 7, partial [Clarias magur]
MIRSDTRVTLAERARESLLSRLMDILSQIISIELDLTTSLSGEMKGFIRHK